jgi:branched-chain amino acid transport system permease protein
VLAIFLRSPESAGGLRQSRWPAIATLLIILIIVAYGFLGNNLATISIFGTVFMYIALTQAWNILGGYGGYLNFGMVTFFGVGAYVTALLFNFFELSPLLTAPAAGAVAALLGILIGIPTLRLRGPYFAIVTMIITSAVQILVLDLPWTQGALGVFVAPLSLDPATVERLFYFIFLSLAFISTLLIYAIQWSNFGWALVAIREDEDAAEVIGVNTARVKLIANAISCFIAGLAGGIYTQRLLYIEPTGMFAFDISLNIVLMAIIGGAGTWQGPLIGVPLVLLTADALRVTFTSEVNRVLFGFAIVFVALFAIGGIMGFLQSIRRRSFLPN